MKQIVRIKGCNGVIYEERMTETQLRHFLNLVALETCVGVAFQDWTIEIVEESREQRNRQSSSSAYVSGCTIDQQSSTLYCLLRASIRH
jgi:hypothetical protein